jgi:DNA-binding NarL/FixJ family response regulator
VLTPAQALATSEPSERLIPTAAPPASPPPASPSAPDPLVGLTAREREVLRLLAAGLSYTEIAKQLVISPYTVNRHLTSIYTKLNVTSRHAATRFALDHGLA